MTSTKSRINESNRPTARTRQTPDMPVKLGSYYSSGIRFKALINYLSKLEPKDMLVIGCERGYVESQLPETISITSIDIVDEHVRDAALRNSGIANRKFITMNLFDIPEKLPGPNYDAVVLSEVIEHLEDDYGAVKIAFEALRPGGELILTVPNTGRFANKVRKALGSAPRMMSYGPGGHIREYTGESVVDLVTRAGFSCERITGVDFWLPFDRAFQPVIPVGFAGRRIAGEKWMGAATWFELHCRKPLD